MVIRLSIVYEYTPQPTSRPPASLLASTAEARQIETAMDKVITMLRIMGFDAFPGSHKPSMNSLRGDYPVITFDHPIWQMK